jgi:hypothetical protein
MNYKSERQLVVAYIMWNRLLEGSFFQTYDRAVVIAERFLEKYPYSKEDWGVEEKWDETVEKFVEEINVVYHNSSYGR